MSYGHGEKWSRKKDAAILALISESTLAEAAKKADIHVSTLKRWRQQRSFRIAYAKAQSELVERAVNQLQSAMTLSVDTLVNVVKNGTKESDRIRAAVAVLQHGFKGMELADALRPPTSAVKVNVRRISDVFELLAQQLTQVNESQLGTAQKAQLVSQLSNDLLRALNTEILQQRIEALEAVIKPRKGASS